MKDQDWMRLALAEARLAWAENEVPVGAVLVRDGAVLAQAHNLCETRHDATAHAELIALQAGAAAWGDLNNSTLYVTLEPCAMCTGAAILSRIGRIVFGAFDERAGCCGSVMDMADHWFNHSIPVEGGLLETECAALLTSFFEQRRSSAR